MLVSYGFDNNFYLLLSARIDHITEHNDNIL